MGLSEICRRWVGRLCVLTVVFVASAPVAGAATVWRSLRTSGQLNISDLVGSARDQNGTLHVAWQRRTPDGLFDLWQTPVRAGGAVGSPTAIVTGWGNLQGPTLLTSGGELFAVFSGIRTDDPLDPSTGLNFANTVNDGASWMLMPSAIAAGQAAYGDDASAALGPGGLLTAWFGSDIEGTLTHVGTDPGTPVQGGFASGSGGGQAIAVSGTDALVAWCEELEQPDGVFVEPVDPLTAVPAGPARLMPGSASLVGGRAEAYCPATTRVPLVARQDKGFFVASVNEKRDTVRGWVVGARRSVALSTGSQFKDDVAAAASPGKRASVWVAWDVNDETVQLRRSNADATVFGATVTLPVPPGGTLYGLDLNAQADRVDLIARVQASHGVRLEHAQSFPGLTLIADGGRHASFRVLDAGDPVAGATVTVAGQSATTGRDGRAEIDIDQPGRYTARVSAPNYVGASATLRISRP